MKKIVLLTSILVSGFLFTSNQTVKAATPMETGHTTKMIKTFTNRMNTFKVSCANYNIAEVTQEVETIQPCPYGHDNCDGNHSECPQGHDNCDGTHQAIRQRNGNGRHAGEGSGHHQGNGNCIRQ